MAKDSTGIEDLHVLIVEDDTQFLNLIASMLRSLGVGQIYTAKDGKQALELLDSSGDARRIDLIMCDWDMPHMNGLELLREVRNPNPAFPFIMVTGLANEQMVTDARAAGVTAFLAKPFTLGELKKKLTVAMRPSAGGGIPEDDDWLDI